jgi:hypothetical protein
VVNVRGGSVNGSQQSASSSLSMLSGFGFFVPHVHVWSPQVFGRQHISSSKPRMFSAFDTCTPWLQLKPWQVLSQHVVLLQAPEQEMAAAFVFRL